MKKLFFILLTLSLTSFGQTAATMLAKSEALVAKIYKAQEIKIGSQTWISKNLDVSSYRNGDPIPEVQDKEAWAILTTGAWCYYENKTANGTKYGKLHNWHAVNDPRGLAPSGYHIPSDAEWTLLTDNLGDEAGTKMKSTRGWLKNGNGANTSGFEELPGGCRNFNGNFFDIGAIGNWWGPLESNIYSAWYHSLYSDNDNVIRNLSQKQTGLSVRCIKD